MDGLGKAIGESEKAALHPRLNQGGIDKFRVSMVR